MQSDWLKLWTSETLSCSTGGVRELREVWPPFVINTIHAVIWKQNERMVKALLLRYGKHTVHQSEVR